MQITATDVREAVQRSMSTKTIKSVMHVWNVFENSWVTEAYWNFVSGQSTVDPGVRSYDTP